MDNDAKLRPWILAKILYERTDYEHSLTTAQLMKILEEEYHMPTHRTTIGYVPEKDNIIFARLMDAGKMLAAKIKDIEKKGSFTKIAIGIYLVDF